MSTVFVTKSIPLSAFLLWCGKPLLSVTKPNGLCIFSFVDDDGTCKDLANSFFADEPTPEIASTIELIHAVHNIRRRVIEASAEARKNQNQGMTK